MSRLPWLDDKHLEEAVFNLLARAKSAKNEASSRMAKNVVDPFSSLILATVTGLNDSETLSLTQQSSSISSAISNAVGDFHQEVLGHAPGFTNHDAGYDLECADKRIIAEIKNKHNTMNAANRREVIGDLGTALRQKRGQWTAYLVTVIPKRPQRFRKKLAEQKIYEIDGASFYELVTGYEGALHDLYYAVAKIAAPADSVLEYCQSMLKTGIPE